MFRKFKNQTPRDDSPFAPTTRKRRYLIPGIVAAVVLANALVFLAVRSDAFKNWRANRLAASATELIAKGDYTNAAGETISALQLAPKNPEVLRATALLNLKLGTSQANPFYHTLLASGGWKSEDFLDAEEAALSAGDLQFYQKLQDMLPANLRRAARYSALQSGYYIATGNLPAALEAARDALAREPGNVEYAISLAGLLLASGSADGVTQARSDLDRVAAKGKPPQARKALALLMQSGQVPAAVRIDYAKRLAARPDAQLEDKLAAATITIQLDPASRETVVRELVSRYSDKDPATLKALGAWLVHNGALAQAESLFPLQRALTRKDYFLIWIDAVAGQHRWQEVQTVLRGDNVPVEAPYLFLYRGRAASELGDDFAAEKNYDNAVSSARGDVSALMYLAAYFRMTGVKEAEIQALRQMAGVPSASRYAYEALLTLAQKERDTNAVLKVLHEMAALWPNDGAVLNDITYINLIRGQDLSFCLNDALRRHKAAPAMFPYSITYALALLENGQPKPALDLFRESNVPLGNLLPWQRAVFAAILAGNGLNAGAVEVASTIPGEALTADERAFLLRHLSASGH